MSTTDSILAAAADIASAVNAAATVNFAAISGSVHVVTDVVCSYSAAPPAGAQCTVRRGGSVVVRRWYVPTAGPLHILFDPPVHGADNEQMEVILSAGAVGVTGEVSAGHYTKRVV